MGMSTGDVIKLWKVDIRIASGNHLVRTRGSVSKSKILKVGES